jgi:hypothetical protein
MKMHLTITIDEEVLKNFRQNCAYHAFNKSLIIERVIKNFNDKIEADKKKNEGGMNNGSSENNEQGTV